METTKQLDQEYVANTYGRFPVVLTGGKGSILTDENGKRYIDLGTGIAVNTFGAADDQWIAAVTAQLGQIQHTSNLYYTSPCAQLARMLCERTGMKKVFFCNSGAEANECAIKTARKWAFDRWGDESHSTIITLKNSFHGRTIATLSATGQETYHTKFGPFLPGFVHADADDIDQVKQLAEDNACCAVMVEIVQGEGGVVPLSEGFLQGLKELTAEKNLLLIVDEVQTGNGRSGKLYAYMHYGLQPDIVTTAKGLGGGLPLGAALLGRRVEHTLGAGDHGSTFGGNPVACAGAVNILSRIDDALLDGVAQRSAYIREQLEGAGGVRSVTGLGLMLGVETERPAKEVVAECLENGVLVLTAKSKVRLLPALNIPMEELASAIEVLKEVCAK